MPKRATITFSSDDAPTVDSEELHVYYCKWSGKHAMTTNCDLRRAPRRRADNSSVRARCLLHRQRVANMTDLAHTAFMAP